MSSPEDTVGNRLAGVASPGELSRRVREQFAMLSYWAAIVLPLFYLPLLLARVDTVESLLALLALFGVHVLALVGGRSHRRPPER